MVLSFWMMSIAAVGKIALVDCGRRRRRRHCNDGRMTVCFILGMCNDYLSAVSMRCWEGLGETD